jgi:hypothetical protein
MKNSKILWMFLFLYLLLNCSAQENGKHSWTRFRGSDGTGIDSLGSVPENWDNSDFAWVSSLPGVGYASPVVRGSKIFVTSADDAKNKGYVMAIEEQDGRILWQITWLLPPRLWMNHSCTSSGMPENVLL